MFGKYAGSVRQFLAGYTACLLPLCYGSAVGWIAPIQMFLESDRSPVGRLSEYQIAWLASLPYVASMTIGIFVFGSINKLVGRKTMAYILATIYLVSNVAIYSTTNFILMLAARFVIGACLPGSVSTISLYITEISDSSVRGALGSGIMLFCNAGIILMFLINSVLTYEGYNTVLISMPACFMVVFWMMPESPVYFLKINRLEDCRKSLSWLKATNDEDVLTNEVGKLRMMFFSQESGKRSLSWREVFATPYYRKALFLGIVLLASICSSGVTTIETYSYTILSHCMDGRDPGNYPTYMLMYSLLSTVVSLFIMDRFSRRFTAISTRLCCATLLSIIGILLLLKDVYNYSIPFMYFFVVFFTYFVIFNMGFSNVVFVIMGEMFSVECRDKFMQPLMLLHFFFHGIYVLLYPITVKQVHLYSWIFIHAGITLTFAVLLVAYLPETRNRSIAEIAQEMNKHKVSLYYKGSSKVPSPEKS